MASRGARDNFDNLIGWHVAAFDAMILSQTVALALEAHGLGICYMGTTLFVMQDIAEYKEEKDKKSVSLNEAERLADQAKQDEKDSVPEGFHHVAQKMKSRARVKTLLRPFHTNESLRTVKRESAVPRIKSSCALGATVDVTSQRPPRK